MSVSSLLTNTYHCIKNGACYGDLLIGLDAVAMVSEEIDSPTYHDAIRCIAVALFGERTNLSGRYEDTYTYDLGELYAAVSYWGEDDYEFNAAYGLPTLSHKSVLRVLRDAADLAR